MISLCVYFHMQAVHLAFTVFIVNLISLIVYIYSIQNMIVDSSSFGNIQEQVRNAETAF